MSQVRIYLHRDGTIQFALISATGKFDQDVLQALRAQRS